MDYLHATDEDYDNPDPLSAPRGVMNAFLITAAAIIAIVVGFCWH